MIVLLNFFKMKLYVKKCNCCGNGINNGFSLANETKNPTIICSQNCGNNYFGESSWRTIRDNEELIPENWEDESTENYYTEEGSPVLSKKIISTKESLLRFLKPYPPNTTIVVNIENEVNELIHALFFNEIRKKMNNSAEDHVELQLIPVSF